jgi:hypothetical protein
MVFSIAVHTTLFVQVYTANFTRDLTFVYRRRGLKSRPTLAIFILIILSFTGATICWAMWIAGLAIQIRWTLVKNNGMDLYEKMALSNAAMIKLGFVQFFFASFLVL